MDISIILLNYKQKGLLKQCIKGIVTANPKLEYEIIVVDNDSSDGSLSMVNKMFEQTHLDASQIKLAPFDNLKIPPIITIAAARNGGFAYGNNLGIKQANGKYIVVMNPDVAVVPAALEKMFMYLESNLSVGMIGPKLINPDGSVQYSCRRWPSLMTPFYRRSFLGKLPWAKNPLNNYLMQDFDHNSDSEVDWLFAACVMIRKSCLDKVGLFDERFFMYFEDLDLCRRFWESGYKIKYYSQVEMVHYHGRLSAAKKGLLGVFSKGGRIHFYSGIKYFAKYLGVKLPVKN